MLKTISRMGSSVFPGTNLISTVTISAAATTNINNCFTSTYRNYLITSNLTTSANTGVAIRLRAAGSDSSANVYGVAYRYSNFFGAGTGDQQSGATTQWNMHISNLCRDLNMNLMLFSPQVASPTSGTFNNINSDNSVNNNYFFVGGLGFTDSTQFDGFSIYTGGVPTLSGTIRIYGLTN